MVTLKAGSPMTPRNVLKLRWLYNVIRGIDGYDADVTKRATEEACAVTDKTVSADVQNHHRFRFAANKQGTHDFHGAPLGDAGNRADPRTKLGWKYAPPEIPSEIYAQWDAKEAGRAKEFAWNEKFRGL